MMPYRFTRKFGWSVLGRPVWLAVLLAALAMTGVTGCIRVPGGNLASLLGGQAGHTDKPSDEAAKKLRNELDITESPAYLRNPEAGLIAYTNTDYTTAVSAAGAGKSTRTRPGGETTPLSPANVVCVRMPLRDWEAGQNNFEGSPAWQVLSGWLSAKRALGLRIDCTSRDDLPSWMAARVPLIESAPGQPPIFWDGDYVRHHKALVSWLGSKLETNGADRLQLVVITGADWDSPLDFAKADASFRADKHAELVTELVEHYHSVFTARDTSGKPKFRFAQLYISRRAVERAGPQASGLVSLLKAKKIRVLDEGLSSSSTAATGLSPEWISDFRPMLGEGFAARLASAGGGLEAEVRNLVTRYKPQYLQLAPARTNAQAVCDASADALERGAAGMGPRLWISRAVFPTIGAYGLDVPVELTWRNTGTVTPEESYLLDFNFLQSDGTPAGTVQIRVPWSGDREFPTTTWRPGFQQITKFKVKAPLKSPSGILVFNVAVSMAHPSDPERRLELAMPNRTTDGRYYRLGQIKVGN